MLLQLIEEKREVLLCLGKTYGLTAKETIDCSQELDQLLNRLEGFMNESSKEK
ncbi:aspartyl-phosphate phosphatase Spo0E family protein [Fictibacillus nanhaiensis]|uniref:aspartyl-phosphate phosphatase Spo0E family protein n=1 Tax=Fictibacillus nanhaiensis TaxID=742169 RepID=UPI001C93E0C9|nr:aspartyl-phosphate phosphatase Spo0E family protein [Fictibacillus nanhaiensis]MBY6037849.1 aspartyl-phosphate phosphatase Spo0E family protein [Fictibacillus nanhaiensis]